jgi:PEP-CTERM motif
MSFTLKFCLLQRSFLTRLLRTTWLCWGLMTASAAGVHAEDVTVQGSVGVDGADGVNPGDPGQPGFPAGPTFADASSADPLNKATAFGGTGGQGGNVGDVIDNIFVFNSGAIGGTGGDAEATAATSVISGSGEADAISVGGTGGAGGGSNGLAARGGAGGSASSLAVVGSGTGNATASASATGGSGGSNRFGQGPDSAGGDASASSSAGTSGSGDALSSANATGGGGGSGTAGDIVQPGGNAAATADASATGGGKAIANAVATQGFPSEFDFPFPPAATANATSNAETVNGAMAEAISAVGGLATAANGAVGEAKSTAKTSLGGVSVQSTIMAPSSFVGIPALPTTDAIAQGGSAPAFSINAQNFAFSTVLTDKAYATTLIGGASNVADAFLGSQDEIFGTADQFGHAFQAGVGTATSTFDFRDPGDLLLGVVDTFGSVDVIVNGAQIFEIGGSVTDTVINLGNLGPNIDLTINGFGIFAFGGVVEAVPEPSTWALMLLGFGGLGFVGYRTKSRVDVRVV